MLGTGRCDLCWEVEKLLGVYAKTARGRANLRRYGMEGNADPIQGPSRTQIRVHPANLQRGDVFDDGSTVVGVWRTCWAGGTLVKVVEVCILTTDNHQRLVRLWADVDYEVTRRSPERATEEG
jgi:hypothetical protein